MDGRDADGVREQHGEGLPGAVAEGLSVDGHLAVGETVILLHLPLPVAGVSIVMERGRQQNDSLADGYGHQDVGVVRQVLDHLLNCGRGRRRRSQPLRGGERGERRERAVER